MAIPLYFVRPDEDWVISSTMSATSERVRYEASRAQNSNPDEPWWATSGTATLTATFSTPSRPTGLLGIVMNNGDDTRTITIGGVGISNTLNAIREKSGYPRDLALLVSSTNGATVSSVSFSIAGNGSDWAIGRVVVGRVRSVRNFLDGVTTVPWRSQEVDEGIPTFGSDIRYDVGAEHLKVEGSILCETTAEFTELHDWYSATRMGFYPTFIYFDDVRYPPMYARMQVGERVTRERQVLFPVTFVSVGRGIEVFGT